jgi:hypothetical protein
MNFHLFRAASATVFAFAALCLLGPPAAFAQASLPSKLVVGVYNRTYLVQAFYRSPAWAAKMQALMEERNKAAGGTDLDAVDRLDKELANAQALAQKQLAGEAPLKNILDALKGQWAAIAQETRVDLIVSEPVYAGPGAAFVDVTPAMVKHLTAKN